MKIQTLMNSLLIGLFYFFISCSPAYIPTPINTPLFSGKSEFQLTVYTGLLNNYGLQTSYSLTNNLGVILNTSFFVLKPKFSDNYYRDLAGDIGLGYYKRFDRNLVFETFVGYGRGFMENKTNNIDANYSIPTSKFYLYPTFGHFSEYFDYAFSMRLASFSYNYENNKYNDFYIEPVATMKTGNKNLKFIGQIGWSAKMNPGNYPIMNTPFLFAIGAQINFKTKKYNIDKTEGGFFR